MTQEASRRGYQILNSSGRVVETVAPALTDEERAEKAAAEAEQARLAELEKQRLTADRQLLSAYSHPDDVILALRRKLEQMRSLISLKEGNIANLSSQVRQEQSRAADLERSGREISNQIRSKIAALQSEIESIEIEIERQEQDIVTVIAEYEAKVNRLEDLTDSQRTLTLERQFSQSGS